MMERWEVYAVFAVSYAEMSMYKSTILLIMYAHWTACLWGVVAHPMLVGDDAWTWKHAYELKMTDPRLDGGKHFHIGNARHSYLASLYMAVREDGPEEEEEDDDANPKLAGKSATARDTPPKMVGFRPDFNPDGFTYKRRETAALKKPSSRLEAQGLL